MKTRKWSDEAQAKREEGCRVCGAFTVELAHVTGRIHDRPRMPGSQTVWVEPESVVPLCPTHHAAHDAHRLDLLPYLRQPEEIRAIEDLGSIGLALKRICPDQTLQQERAAA